MGYTDQSHMPHWTWYGAIAFLIGVATYASVAWTPFSVVLYLFPVHLFFVGWGKAQEQGNQPARRSAS